MVLTDIEIDENSPSEDERAAVAVLRQHRSSQHIAPDYEVRNHCKLDALLTTSMQDEEAPRDVQYRQKTRSNQSPVLSTPHTEQHCPSEDERVALAVVRQHRSSRHIVPDSEVRNHCKLDALLTTSMQDEEAPRDVQYRQKTRSNQPPVPSGANTEQHHVIQDDNEEALVSN